MIYNPIPHIFKVKTVQQQQHTQEFVEERFVNFTVWSKCLRKYFGDDKEMLAVAFISAVKSGHAVNVVRYGLLTK